MNIYDIYELVRKGFGTHWGRPDFLGVSDEDLVEAALDMGVHAEHLRQKYSGHGVLEVKKALHNELIARMTPASTKVLPLGHPYLQQIRFRWAHTWNGQEEECKALGVMGAIIDNMTGETWVCTSGDGAHLHSTYERREVKTDGGS